MTLTYDPCPACGGRPPPPVPLVTTRRCELGIALVVDGVTIAHLGPGESAVLGVELTGRARDEDPFYTSKRGVAA